MALLGLLRRVEIKDSLFWVFFISFKIYIMRALALDDCADRAECNLKQYQYKDQVHFYQATCT